MRLELILLQYSTFLNGSEGIYARRVIIEKLQYSIISDGSEGFYYLRFLILKKEVYKEVYFI